MIQLPTPFQTKAMNHQSRVAGGGSCCCTCSCCLLTVAYTSTFTAKHFINLSNGTRQQPIYHQIEPQEQLISPEIVEKDIQKNTHEVVKTEINAKLKVVLGILGALIFLVVLLAFIHPILVPVGWVASYVIAYTIHRKSKLEGGIFGFWSFFVFLVAMCVEGILWIMTISIFSK